jgi:hypothetical protein
MPTYWVYGSVTGITLEVLGTGTTGGFTYVDVKFAGTNSSGTALLPNVRFEGGQQIVAANTQSWTGSFYVATVGTPTGVTSYAINIDEIDSTGSNLNATSQPFTPTSSLSRITATRPMNNASCAFTRHRVVVSVADGATIDLTLRIAAPQLEQGAFATSYIPTTGATATRATEVAEITSISSFYNQSEGTIFAEGSVQTSLNLPALVSIDNSTADERLQLRRNDTSSQGFFTVVDGGNPLAGIQTGSWTTSSQVAKMAAAYKVDDFAASFGGGAAATDTGGTIPTPTRLQIGRGISAAVANGHIRKIAYWPRRLSNTLLQQLTT